VCAFLSLDPSKSHPALVFSLIRFYFCVLATALLTGLRSRLSVDDLSSDLAGVAEELANDLSRLIENVDGVNPDAATSRSLGRGGNQTLT
jgi:hypothetical protein